MTRVLDWDDKCWTWDDKNGCDGNDDRVGFGNETHRAILRLQGLDALGDVTIIDVAAVNFHEVLER